MATHRDAAVGAAHDDKVSELRRRPVGTWQRGGGAPAATEWQQERRGAATKQAIAA